MHAASSWCQRRSWPSGELQPSAEPAPCFLRLQPLARPTPPDTGAPSPLARPVLCPTRICRSRVSCAPPLLTLLARRESIHCAEDSQDLSVSGPSPGPRPATAASPVIEAHTPSGAVSLRVRAVALPARVALALDQNQALLREAAGRSQAGPGEASAAAEGPEAPAPAEGSRGGPAGSSMGLAQFGGRLRSMGEEAGGQLPAILSRIWMFGAKRVGPNLLLASPQPPPPQQQQQPAPPGAQPGSLWDVPPASVVQLAKPQQPRAPVAAAVNSAGSAAKLYESGDVSDLLPSAAQVRHVSVPLGSPLASVRLGLAAGTARDAAANSEGGAGGGNSSSSTSPPIPPAAANGNSEGAQHADHAIAALATSLAAVQLHTSSSSSSSAAREAAAAAQLSASAGVGGAVGHPAGPSSSSRHSRTAEYLRSSLESGVAAGFQLASAAGPLCDEPMWGLAFEIEARLNVQCGPGGGGGELSLEEDVYGPFTGQVGCVCV